MDRLGSKPRVSCVLERRITTRTTIQARDAASSTPTGAPQPSRRRQSVSRERPASDRAVLASLATSCPTEAKREQDLLANNHRVDSAAQKNRSRDLFHK